MKGIRRTLMLALAAGVAYACLGGWGSVPFSMNRCSQVLAQDSVETPDLNDLAASFELADYERCLVQSKQVLKSSLNPPLQPKAAYFAAASLLQLGRYEESMEYCTLVLKGVPGAGQESELARQTTSIRIRNLIEMRRPDEARAEISALVRSAPNSEEAWKASVQQYNRLREGKKLSEVGMVTMVSKRYEADPDFRDLKRILEAEIPPAMELVCSALGVDRDKMSSTRVFCVDLGEWPVWLDGWTAKALYKDDFAPAVFLSNERLMFWRGDLRRLLVHEFSHCAHMAMLGSDFAKVPRWLTEGLAQWVAKEGAKVEDFLLQGTPEAIAADLPTGRKRAFAATGETWPYIVGAEAFKWLEENIGADRTSSLAHALIRSANWKDAIRATPGVSVGDLEYGTKTGIVRFCETNEKPLVDFLGIRARARKGLWAQAEKEYAQFALSRLAHPLALVARWEGARCRALLGHSADSIKEYRECRQADWSHFMVPLSYLWEAEAQEALGDRRVARENAKRFLRTVTGMLAPERAMAAALIERCKDER